MPTTQQTTSATSAGSNAIAAKKRRNARTVVQKMSATVAAGSGLGTLELDSLLGSIFSYRLRKRQTQSSAAGER